MKHFSLIYCLFSFVINYLFAQTNQVYSGNFTDDQGIVGKASYSYYEKDYVKVKNGEFEFSYYSNGISRELKGSFNDGFREGLWTSKISGGGLSVTINGNFKNGLPNGVFNYHADYKGNLYQTLTIEFKQGVLIGDFNFEDKRKGEKVIGKVSDDGFMIGDWKIIEGNTEYIQKYDKGCFVLYIERNVNDGNITRKDDYESSIIKLKDEDIIVKNSQWDLTNENDVYGEYIHKIWDNWDPKSVGGIKENPISGMFFIRKTPKKKMEEYGMSLLDEKFFNSINFNKEDSLKTIFQTYKKYNDKIIESDKYFEIVKENILSNEVNLRDSVSSLIKSVLNFQQKYFLKNQSYQELLTYADLLINNIEGSIDAFENIQKVTYNGKQFTGLLFPSDNQFDIDQLVKIRSEINSVKQSMNYQSALSLVTFYYVYDSLLLNFSNKIIEIETNTLNDQNRYFKLKDPNFVIEPRKVLNDLKTEILQLTDQNNKFLKINNGDKILEKLIILQDFYYSLLPTNYSLFELQVYVSKLIKLNDKMDEILKSDEAIKTLVKNIKKEENIQVLEQFFLQ